jgi:hypothetical protein
MEDFALRFAPHAQVISQLDDDSYSMAETTTCPPTFSPCEACLHTYFIKKNPSVGQFKVMGKWFGACRDAAASSNDTSFVLQRSDPSLPVYGKYTWRFDPTGWYVASCMRAIVTWCPFSLMHYFAILWVVAMAEIQYNLHTTQHCDDVGPCSIIPSDVWPKLHPFLESSRRRNGGSARVHLI